MHLITLRVVLLLHSMVKYYIGSREKHGLQLLFAALLSGILFVLGIQLSFYRRQPASSVRTRCKEPSMFGGDSSLFREWLFTMDEAIRTLSPPVPVSYAASFLKGNARMWLIDSWGKGAGLSTWQAFRQQLLQAFSSLHEEERSRIRLV